MQQSSSFISRICNPKMLFLITLFVFITSQYLYVLLGLGGESQTLLEAKVFFNPNYLHGDWFFQDLLPYRSLFNGIAGFMLYHLQLEKVSLIFRLIIFALFSIAYMRLFTIFKIDYFLLIPFAFIVLMAHSFAASEWMVRTVETKPFAYFFILLALGAFIKKDFYKMAMLVGAACSLHVLVGLYAAFCFTATVIVFHKEYKLKEYSSMLKAIPLFLLSGAVAIYAIFSNLISRNSYEHLEVARIYVFERFQHHMLFSHFRPLWYLYLAGFLIAFAILLYKTKNRDVKKIIVFASSSLVFWIVGIACTLSGKFYYLKYYLYRFGDTIIPFIFFLLVAYLVTPLFTRYKKISIGLCLIFSITITLKALPNFYYHTRSIFTNEYYIISNKKSGAYIEGVVDLFEWVKNNTRQDEEFLVDPRWYVFQQLTHRPVFVNQRNCPNIEKHVTEWYYRYSTLKNYNDTPAETFITLSKKYTFKYIVVNIGKELPFKKAYQNDRYIVYKIANK